MPVVTSVDAASIFTGLIVVLARTKSLTPDFAIKSPTSAKPPATIQRQKLSSGMAGAIPAKGHIPAAAIRTTIGGGILCSSQDIT
jgi:hypothetical protein